MCLSNSLYPLLSTGSIQDDWTQHDGKILDWDVKNRNKQTKLLTLSFPIDPKHSIIISRLALFTNKISTATAY